MYGSYTGVPDLSAPDRGAMLSQEASVTVPSAMSMSRNMIALSGVMTTAVSEWELASAVIGN